MSKRLPGLAFLLLLVVIGGCVKQQPSMPDAALPDDGDIRAALTGKIWVAEVLLGQPVVDMSHSSMVLDLDGGVKGRGGCNAYSGTYTLKGSTLSFGPMAATMRMCAPALSDQEARFFTALSEPVTVSFKNGLLYLTPSKGEPSRFSQQN